MISVRSRREELIQIGRKIVVQVMAIDPQDRSVVLHVHKPGDVHVVTRPKISRTEINSIITTPDELDERLPLDIDWIEAIGFVAVPSPDGPEFEPHYELGSLNICQCESGAWCVDAADFIEMETRGDLLALIRMSGLKVRRPEPAVQCHRLWGTQLDAACV